MERGDDSASQAWFMRSADGIQDNLEDNVAKRFLRAEATMRSVIRTRDRVSRAWTMRVKSTETTI
jgi:hypothetical protein